MLRSGFYDILVNGVLVLVALAACLLLATLLHHLRVGIRLWRHRLRGEVLLPLLCRAVSDPTQQEALLTAHLRGDREVLMPMLLQLALDLRGEEADRIAELAEELEVSSFERRRLGRWSAEARAEAVKNLGLLRSAKDLPALVRLARQDERAVVRVAAAGALGEIGGPEAVQGLLEMLDDPRAGVVRRAQEVLLYAAPDAARQIVDHARRTRSLSARRAAVELLGALRDPQASELLLELVDDPDPELRTKSVKSAAAIGDPRFLEVFRARLGDPVWSVRCQAATGLGAIGATQAIPELYAALEDDAWWVRFNAAAALAELGPPGRAALAEASTCADSQRREVARYVLDRTLRDPLAA